MSKDAPVAIIMRSKDEYPYVKDALEALEKQSYTNWVLYNCDSGSQDGTWETVLKYNSYPDRIVRISPEDYVPGRVLNLMTAMAKEPLVVFLNADAIPLHKDWLEKLVRPILEGEVDATMSRQLPREDAYFVVKYDYERAYDRKNIEGKNDDFFSAVSCAFRRELWLDTKFYVEGFSEDMAWAKVLREKGFRFQLIEESLVEHSHNYTLKQLFRRKWIEGEADFYIYNHAPSLIELGWRWSKELARDGWHALRCGQVHTIPYNMVYRTVGYFGFVKGYREGVQNRGLQVNKEGQCAPLSSYSYRGAAEVSGK